MRQRLRAVVVRGVGEVTAGIEPRCTRIHAPARAGVDDAKLLGLRLGQLVGDPEVIRAVVGHVRPEDPEHRDDLTPLFDARTTEVAEELVRGELRDHDVMPLHGQIAVDPGQRRDRVVTIRDQTHQPRREAPEESLPRYSEVAIAGMHPHRGNRFGQGHVLDWTDDHRRSTLFSLGKNHTA